jgi:hypothetical protein
MSDFSGLPSLSSFGSSLSFSEQEVVNSKPWPSRSILTAVGSTLQYGSSLVGRLFRRQPSQVTEESQPPKPSLRILKTKYRGPLRRTNPLNFSLFASFLDELGTIKNSRKLKFFIFAGGIEPELRITLWQYLLGIFPWPSTQVEREQIEKDNLSLYETLRYRAQLLILENKEKVDVIEKDVIRCDRCNEFFAGENNVNVDKARKILLTYFLVLRQDVSYTQGLTDYVSIMLLATKGDEATSFWLFFFLLKFMGVFFFESSENQMNRQFNYLIQLIKDYDPEVFDSLQKKGAQDIIFVYRWLLLNFKREFTLYEALIIFEVIWSMPTEDYVSSKLDLGPNPYSLFIALAIVKIHRDAIIELDSSIEVIMYMNNLLGSLDVNDVLCQSEELFWNYVRGEIPEKRLRYC